jgi:thiamine-monophosphate kinase
MAPLTGRLGDHGERRLIAEHLDARYRDRVPSFGDDCAVVMTQAAGTVIATTDPAPQPVAWELGFADYYYWGWLLAAINLSDLGAAGGSPLGLLSSLTLPNEMTVFEFDRLLDGIDECCAAVGTGVIGGNLKEAADGVVRCEATAIGWVEGGTPVSRAGANAGDVIVAFGPTGAFWSAVLAITRGVSLKPTDLEEVLGVLLRPTPQILIGGSLRGAKLLNSATDASDGLYAAVRSLTIEHGLGAQLELAAWDYPAVVARAAVELAVSPVRLALGFGDLQLVAAIAPDSLGAVTDVAKSYDTHLMALGTVTDSKQLLVRTDDDDGPLSNFDNERFTRESQFTGGLKAYWTRLLERPLVDHANS